MSLSLCWESTLVILWETMLSKKQNSISLVSEATVKTGSNFFVVSMFLFFWSLSDILTPVYRIYKIYIHWNPRAWVWKSFRNVDADLSFLLYLFQHVLQWYSTWWLTITVHYTYIYIYTIAQGNKYLSPSESLLPRQSHRDKTLRRYHWTPSLIHSLIHSFFCLSSQLESSVPGKHNMATWCRMIHLNAKQLL